jgi:PAS domain S-box-containing protein
VFAHRKANQTGLLARLGRRLRRRVERLVAPRAAPPEDHELSAAELGALLAHAPLGIALVNRELSLMRVNKPFLRKGGGASDVCAGRPLREALVEELVCVIEPHVRACFERGANHAEATEFEQEVHAGGHRWLQIDVFPVIAPDGSVGSVGVVLRNISDRKRIEAIAAAAQAERDHLLDSERAARAEAERANRLKDEFLATLSHELRTPLTAILGWAQLLRLPAHPCEAPEKVARGIGIIERNARLQAQLVADLLDVSRIIRGQLRLDVQPVDVKVVIDGALESVRHAAEAKKIRIEAAVAPRIEPVLGDPARLQQVVWNLLSNAVKFTPSGGRVEVRAEPGPEGVSISVCDTGLGIAPDFVPHVFERFRQADASLTRAHSGLGLGLAIVKHLVELHGGTVGVSSAGPRKGATFTVTLPVRSAAPPTKSNGAASAASTPRGTSVAVGQPSLLLRGVRVLVVEDDADTRELVENLLADAGASVTAVGSAGEALSLLASGQKPDVLVSDLSMPGMDGYGLIRAIRERTASLPAVALTAFARPEDRARALSAGYQSHLVKPVEPNELLATVAGLSR